MTIRRRILTTLAIALAIGSVALPTAFGESPGVVGAPTPSTALSEPPRALSAHILPLRSADLSVTTTTTPETTTTTAPTRTPVRPAAPPTTQPPVVEAAQVPIAIETRSGDPADPASWDRLAQCEAGGDWHIDTGNGYFGGLQFSLSSWRAVGGTGYPHEHPRETQIEMGQRLHAQGGWGHWPACTRSFGWR